MGTRPRAFRIDALTCGGEPPRPRLNHFLEMTLLWPRLCLAALLLGGASARAQDRDFHVYLCLGQSNMEGYPGIPDADKDRPDDRFQVLAAVDFPALGREQGRWYAAVPPLCRPDSGLSPADGFGRTLVAALPRHIRVGVVNVSVAGAKIEVFHKEAFPAYAASAPEWMKPTLAAYGGDPYAHLVRMAKIAQRSGVIKGILLHQGESNSGDPAWPAKVKAVYQDLLADLGLHAADVPLLVGGLLAADQHGKCASMNAVIAELPKTIPTAHPVDSSGCEGLPDGLHFSPAGYRELGRRYAATVLGLLRTAPANAGDPAPVRTESGLVQGTAEGDLAVYRGIPFAAPPVGPRRWRAPQRVEPWEGVRGARAFGPDPFQGDGKGHVSEDCLYLNVWTPARSPDARVPVLVWIYGGGFSFGSNTTPVHDGSHLARKGVVLVTLNYRVGPLGFLAHPELSAESPRGVSGNWGLVDQIAGLRWVQRNIAAFGGDPDRVTIFGESAGGIAVSMLCASPEANGLFHGAISQSGGSFGPTRPTTYPGENMRTLRQAEASGVAYAGRAGVSSLAELRRLPPERLPGGWGSGAAWPIVDGWIIPDDQHRLYEAGNYNDVDILVGYNSDEGLSFSRDKSAAEYVANTRARYGPHADALLAAYPPDGERAGRAARNLMRDAAFGWQTWAWATLQARSGASRVFYYYFDQHPARGADAPEADHGMPHGVDVPYVFQTLDRNDSRLTAGDWAISDTVSTYWTNFAKRGDPNGDGVPRWPRFTPEQREVMHFKDTARPGPVPDAEALAVLDAYFAWRRTPEGAAWAQ